MIEQQQIAILFCQAVQTRLPGFDDLDVNVRRVVGKMGSGQIHIQGIVLGVQDAQDGAHRSLPLLSGNGGSFVSSQ